MIRYSFIRQKVLELYSSLQPLRFPISVFDIVSKISNCRIMGYVDAAITNGCSFDSIIDLFGSKDGCTTYDPTSDRYLIFYNNRTTELNNLGRQRWTCAHELGHVMLGHMKTANIGSSSFLNHELEMEADYFAATLLCPFPICDELKIEFEYELQYIFGLSYSAAFHRLNQYTKWKKRGIYTEWDRRIKAVYLASNK